MDLNTSRLDINHTGNSLRTIYHTAIASLFLIVTMTIAIIGNIAVIVVICINRNMRQEISNLLIINLSITDLANAFSVMPSALVSLCMDIWPFGEIWCDFTCALNYCLSIVSMLTMCCISIDRSQAVMKPLTYRSHVTRRRLVPAIIYMWFQAAVFGLAPSLLHWVDFDYWEAICAIQWQQFRPGSIIYVVMSFLLCFLGPGMILVYCYVKIIQEAKKQRDIPVPLSNTNGKRKRSDRNRLIWSLLVVVFAYFICTTPFSLTKLIKVSAIHANIVDGPINLTAALLGYFASAVNPLIYGIFRRDFREAYKKLLQIIFKGSRESTQLINSIQNAPGCELTPTVNKEINNPGCELTPTVNKEINNPGCELTPTVDKEINNPGISNEGVQSDFEDKHKNEQPRNANIEHGKTDTSDQIAYQTKMQSVHFNETPNRNEAGLTPIRVDEMNIKDLYQGEELYPGYTVKNGKHKSGSLVLCKQITVQSSVHFNETPNRNEAGLTPIRVDEMNIKDLYQGEELYP